MLYRPAKMADIDALAVLFDGYRVFYQQASDLRVARDFILQRIQNGDSTILVAENETGELLGFVQLYPIFSSVSARSSLLLNDLFVSSIARRLGVGKGLMQAANNFGQSQGVCWIMLQTEKTNLSAQGLYESLGYQRDNDCFYYYFSN